MLQDNESNKYNGLMPYVSDVSFNKSLLLWHVAIELLYNTDGVGSVSCQDRKFSKIFSDYMLYLLIMQPSMMQAVASIGKIRFRDTCDETRRFFKSKDLRSNEHERACDCVLKVNIVVKPIAVKGDRSKSLMEACLLKSCKS